MAEDLSARGHEVELIVQDGVGHEVTGECLEPMLDWLFAHILCGTTLPGACGADGDADADSDGDSDSRPIADADGVGDGVRGGCQCTAVREPGGALSVVALAFAAAIATARRRRW
jgi:MYXO-CTERM domain-containing protein